MRDRHTFPDLERRNRIAAVNEARHAQRMLIDQLRGESLEHVRSCANCKRELRARVERGEQVPEPLMVAAGLDRISN